MSQVTYTKLKSGEWGLRSTTPLTPGATVQVAKKSGEVKAESVGQLVWSGSGVFLYAVAPASVLTTVGGGGRRRKSSRKCKEPGCSSPATDRGYCDRCAFDNN